MTPTGSKSVRLLVAEDNPLVRDLIEKGMESHCEIIFANDGADALLKVIDEPPDAILCDYKMPVSMAASCSKSCAAARRLATFHSCLWPAERTSKRSCAT